jgi:hypothetical protein
MRSDVAAALVGVGLLSVRLFSAMAGDLLSKGAQTAASSLGEGWRGPLNCIFDLLRLPKTIGVLGRRPALNRSQAMTLMNQFLHR